MYPALHHSSHTVLLKLVDSKQGEEYRLKNLNSIFLQSASNDPKLTPTNLT